MAATLDLLFARRVGTQIYGLGIVVMGLTGRVWGDFAVAWQPDAAPGQGPWGYAFSILPLLLGLAMLWQRTTYLSASVLVGLYALGEIFLDFPRGFAHPAVFGVWYGVFEHLALAAAAVVICAYSATFAPATVGRPFKISRVVFGVCLIYFGLAHHFFLANTVSMVPAWLPPGQTFWAYATGAAHIAAGVALITGIYARPAAMLLGLMFVIFTILVHIPRVISGPHTHMAWAENAVNIALIGSAWVMAASIPAASRSKT